MSVRYFIIGTVLALHWAITFVSGPSDLLLAAMSDWPRWLRWLLIIDASVLPMVALMYFGSRLDDRRDRKRREVGHG